MTDYSTNMLTPEDTSAENTKSGQLVALVPCLENVDLCTDCRIKIGRSNSCDIVIGNSIGSNVIGTISKEHFLIISSHGNVYMVDMSKNGTYRNGVRVKRNEMIALKHGDKIAVGHHSHDVFAYRELTDDDLPPTLSPKNDIVMQTATVVPPWGRLIAYIMYLESVDLYEPTVRVGRSLECDISLNRSKIDPKIITTFSKQQFVIQKDYVKGITFIKDLSTFGTYLNGHLIGKDRQHILQSDDVIAVGKKDRAVYRYISYSQETHYLPDGLRGKYEPSVMLGKGAAGEVRLAFEKRTCEMFAIKRILKSRSTTSQMYKLNHPLKIQSEINILQSLSHPFIIRMQDIIETTDEVFIVLEYMKGGELKSRIHGNTPMTETNVKYLFYQILLAVDYLHKQGVTHRDLKPENVLLATEDMETLVKVSDFGLSKITEEEDIMKTVCGTYYYMAPEVIGTRAPQYNKQVDVWSLGVILYYMLSRSLPFKSTDKKELNRLIVSGNYQMNDVVWQGISMTAIDLVQKMLTIDPQSRITIGDVLRHPWINKDVAVKYRVNRFLRDDMDESSEEFPVDCTKPPLKRLRLCTSEEQTV